MYPWRKTLQTAAVFCQNWEVISYGLGRLNNSWSEIDGLGFGMRFYLLELSLATQPLSK